MRIHRPHMLRRLTTLMLVAVVAAGCSSTSSTDAAVFDQVRDLGQDLNRAVSATQDAVTGYAQPQFAARAIDRASSATRPPDSFWKRPCGAPSVTSREEARTRGFASPAFADFALIQNVC